MVANIYCCDSFHVLLSLHNVEDYHQWNTGVYISYVGKSYHFGKYVRLEYFSNVLDTDSRDE